MNVLRDVDRPDLNELNNGCIHSPPMTESQVIAFLEAVKANPALQAKLDAATDPAVVFQIAQDAGYPLAKDSLDSLLVSAISKVKKIQP
jgi:predicted ribosomally synthesized peptide with nif11-like leader